MKNNNNNLPDFIGVGAMRCGTTWITDMLRSHPDIFIPAHFKELHFFDRYFDKGSDWYAANFSAKKPNQIAGEFTPSYLRDKQALSLIFQTCPSAKLIISIRNPVKRAFSHYNFLKNGGNISNSFYDALFDKRYEILEAGLFGNQLQNCLKYFSRANIHVIIFDDIIDSPETVTSKLYEFLGVEEDHIPNKLTKKSNAGHKVKSVFIATRFRKLKQLMRPFIKSREGLIKLGFFKYARALNRMNSDRVVKDQMDAKAAEYLEQYYKEDLRLLNDLLDGGVSKWLAK